MPRYELLTKPARITIHEHYEKECVLRQFTQNYAFPQHHWRFVPIAKITSPYLPTTFTRNRPCNALGLLTRQGNRPNHPKTVPRQQAKATPGALFCKRGKTAASLTGAGEIQLSAASRQSESLKAVMEPASVVLRAHNLRRNCPNHHPSNLPKSLQPGRSFPSRQASMKRCSARRA